MGILILVLLLGSIVILIIGSIVELVGEEKKITVKAIAKEQTEILESRNLFGKFLSLFPLLIVTIPFMLGIYIVRFILLLLKSIDKLGMKKVKKEVNNK